MLLKWNLWVAEPQPARYSSETCGLQQAKTFRMGQFPCRKVIGFCRHLWYCTMKGCSFYLVVTLLFSGTCMVKLVNCWTTLPLYLEVQHHLLLKICKRILAENPAVRGFIVKRLLKKIVMKHHHFQYCPSIWQSELVDVVFSFPKLAWYCWWLKSCTSW